MPDEMAEQKQDIPSFSDEAGKREIDSSGKSLLQIVNASLDEYRTSIKAELAALQERIVELEKP